MTRMAAVKKTGQKSFRENESQCRLVFIRASHERAQKVVLLYS